MYKLIKLASVLVRQFLLPNPFAALPNGELYNGLATIILVPITFFIVGLFYKRGSAPAVGSFLFLVFYLIHTFILMLCGVFNFNEIACAAIIVIYIAMIIGGVVLKARQKWL